MTEMVTNRIRMFNLTLTLTMLKTMSMTMMKLVMMFMMEMLRETLSLSLSILFFSSLCSLLCVASLLLVLKFFISTLCSFLPTLNCRVSGVCDGHCKQISKIAAIFGAVSYCVR